MKTFSLRRALLPVAASTLALSLLLPATPAAALTLTRIRLVRTSAWIRPSPDPTGISNFPGLRRLIVVDSEIEELRHPHLKGANVWIIRPKGRVLRSFNTFRYSQEPTDVAVGPGGRVLYFSDDSKDMIFIVHSGRDRRWGTRDDVVSSFSTRTFGSHDPMGLGFGAGSLFVTDGDNNSLIGPFPNPHKVFRITAGPNHVFDGAAPAGDDVVTSFDTLALPIDLSAPEDVTFWGNHLFITGQQKKLIVETTLAGTFVTSWDLSPYGVSFASGITFAPSSTGGPSKHIYLTDAGTDNNAAPLENDGRIFEFALTP